MNGRHAPRMRRARATARLALAFLLGGLALAATLAVTLAPSAWAQEQPLDRRVFEIANELRCPTCVSESVGQSSSAIAREMRTLIQEQLEAGASRGEILAFFQARYGDWILLDPPKRGVNLVVWLLPVAAALGGMALLGVLLRRWRAAGEAPVRADPEDLARVRAHLDRTKGTQGDADEEPNASWRS